MKVPALPTSDLPGSTMMLSVGQSTAAELKSSFTASTRSAGHGISFYTAVRQAASATVNAMFKVRAGLKHVRGVRPNRGANFRGGGAILGPKIPYKLTCRFEQLSC